jgi:hypothetical protein
VAYLQTHKSAPVPPRELPVASAVDTGPRNRTERLAAPEPLAPQTAISTAPVAPARLPAPPLKPSPAPDTSVASFSPTVPYGNQTLPDFFVADSPVWSTPVLPDEKLWTRRIYLEANQSSTVGKLSFLNKKSDDDQWRTLNFSNMTDVGTQYPLIKNGDTTFLGRLAGGLSRDYAGLAEGQRIPEVLFGCQFEHQITERHKILGAVEYARDVTDSGRHRVRTQAAWEVLLDPDKNVSLRTGVLESSNKTPVGEQATNLNYTVDLIWKF